MSTPFSKLPSAARISPVPFNVSIPADQLADLKSLVQLSRIAPPTYENSQPDGRFGITSEWLSSMREKWVTEFDWPSFEARMSQFPQFTADIEGINVHFAALFSEREDAVPVTLLHGWPGSFVEFLPILQLFREEFSPETLPYHLIVPSLPGYTFSSGPPLDRNFGLTDMARVVDQLMKDLGFGSGYVVQGGDIGAFVGRVLGVGFEACKVNMCPMPSVPEGMSIENLTAVEKRGVARMEKFVTRGLAYAMEHGTRPSTIGHVLASNPIALLAWVGEKYRDWVDKPLPSATILEMVSLYWLTESFPRAIYPYRETTPLPPNTTEALGKELYIHKPFGYSYFPMEIVPVPQSWVATTGDLVFFREHDEGGHFAALEHPRELKADLVAFIEQVWQK
ncbi:epoxide hydrolase [Aspergillus sclerotioniger CBS 115572]|uniref:Epoxide hydrolase n=1 Tax=Aspergillus sclerotioniger CBS 115572 TaxID=1450535 RepID=A0A317WNJ2_9EURO|nr:epoxide hydrolase [Aspergillus sclerotioniger CBS 115572]PWY88006.1 epoxide hydrolase [Aspergillus sclerotioniger CBS 115572]